MGHAAVELTLPDPGVAVVTFQDPPHNFATFAANERLEAALAEAASADARVVVLTSAVEGVFVKHGWLTDVLAAFTGGETSGDPLAGWRGFQELEQGPLVSIAAVDGEAWGHGAELAWACDLRVASPTATFGQPEVNIGALPGSGGTVRLTRLVGESVAKGLVLDGRPIDGRRAHELGLVHRLVPSGSVRDAALEWARWLASRPAGALAAIGRAFAGIPSTTEEALQHEREIFIERLLTPEVQDHLRATQERYDRGASTAEAFGIEPRPDPPTRDRRLR